MDAQQLSEITDYLPLPIDTVNIMNEYYSEDNDEEVDEDFSCWCPRNNCTCNREQPLYVLRQENGHGQDRETQDPSIWEDFVAKNKKRPATADKEFGC
jgi:hypothetical protein